MIAGPSRPSRPRAHTSPTYAGMPLLFIAVSDDPSPKNDRAYLERNCIALLSNFGKDATDQPSSDWLGLRSGEITVRQSRLWNTNHVEETYSPDVLDRLRSYAAYTMEL